MKTIKIIWSTEDVLAKADSLGVELTEQEADNILLDLERHHDAQIGICWDVIASYIYQHEQQRTEDKLSNDLYDYSAE